MAKIIMDENETVNEAVEVENTETPELDADFSVDANSVEDTSTDTEPPIDDSEIDTDMSVETPEETAPTDKEESSDNTQTEENPDENIDNSEDDGISSLPLEDTDLKPVYDEATGQADNVGDGKKWTDGYTIKTKAADDDEAMILSTSEKANKRIKFSGIWDWIVDKMASAVVSKLTTTDKTILGALNELNSKTLPTRTKDVLPDKLPEGLSLKWYNNEALNRPTDYGVCIYIVYTTWYFVIAFGTYNGGIWLSSKTNEGKWSQWFRISTIK